MVSVRKRKMNKSSIRKATRRLKDSHRKINVTSNPIIAKNWDYSKTMARNYKDLGLVSKLGRSAGGEEKIFEPTNFDEEDEDEEDEQNDLKDSTTESQELDPSEIPQGEARIIKDSEGNIEKIIYGTKKLIDIDAEVVQKQSDSKVVKELEEYANRPTLKTEKLQSVREQAWLKDLYEKYGDDYNAMQWDKKLNINQNSTGDLKRRIKKWKKANNI